MSGSPKVDGKYEEEKMVSSETRREQKVTLLYSNLNSLFDIIYKKIAVHFSFLAIFTGSSNS